MPDLDLPGVYRAFLDAFTYLERANTRVDRFELGNVTHLHWPETGRRGGQYRHEFFGLDVPADEMIATVESVSPVEPWFISEVYGSRGSARAGYEAAGYIRESAEPIMTLALASVPVQAPEATIVDVIDLAFARATYDAFATANSSPRQTSLAQIEDPATLIRTAVVDGHPAAHGKGILAGDMLYITDIGTLPTFRKRGLGAAIMTSLHQSARDLGATSAILSATAMAAPLYRTLGYIEIGTLDIYLPTSR